MRFLSTLRHLAITHGCPSVYSASTRLAYHTRPQVSEAIDYMRAEAAKGNLFGPAYESYENTCMNYYCSTAAVSYLIHRTSAAKVLDEFIRTEQCKQVCKQSPPAAHTCAAPLALCL